MTNHSKCACPHCENHIEYGEEAAGVEVRCPHCGETMVLPVAVEQPSPGSDDSVLSNECVCMECGTTIAFGRDEAGLEHPCPKCNRMVQYPEFYTDELTRKEDEFLRRKDDDYGSYGGKTLTEVGGGKWAGGGNLFGRGGLILLGVVALLAVVAVMFGLKTAGGIAGLLVVGVIVAMVLYPKWVEGRTAKIKALELPKTLGIRGTLQGKVEVGALALSETCSIGVSLVLQVEGSRHGYDEGSSGYEWISLCRSSTLVVSQRSFNPGSQTAFSFSISTPEHHPHEYDDSRGLTSLTNFKKLTRLDSATLLRKQRLQWVLTLELFGADGAFVRSQKTLRVTENKGVPFLRVGSA